MQILQLLEILKKQQISSYKQGYLKGIFASQRFQKPLLKKREDENIFFSATIAHTLQNNLTQFSDSEKEIANSIIQNTISSYKYFKNFKGLNTYNFFKTNPMHFFPNGKIMQHFKFFKLADDSDDTAYVYLTNEKQNHNWLKQKLIKHANGSVKWCKTTPKTYKKLKAYGVYFGEKMHIEIDVCVLTNILLWHFKNFNTEIQQDNDSIEFIIKSIQSKDYLHKPYLISPCYPTTAQICYHVSRLIKNSNNHSGLQKIKPILVNDIEHLLQQQNSKIHQILLHISLMNLEVKPNKKLNYDLDNLLGSTSYFYTSIPLMIPKLWIRKLQSLNIFDVLGLKTTCKAYTTAFALEYEILYKTINHL